MSLMFQHIPVPQTKELFVECDEQDKLAVKGRDGKFYKLDTDKASGFAFEYAETTSEDFGQLDAIRRRGDVCALVFGHDHINCFTAEIDGVNVVQTRVLHSEATEIWFLAVFVFLNLMRMIHLHSKHIQSVILIFTARNSHRL